MKQIDDCGRVMTCNQQLAKWVGGESIHNGITKGSGECCPDFSCCHPDMLWAEEKRLAFLLAEDEKRSKMLFTGLGNLMDYTENRKVVITGGE